MDYNNMFTMKEEKKCESREEIFDPKLRNEFMMDNWTSESMNLLDPMLFDSELFNFNEMDDFSNQIKLEAEEFEAKNILINNNNSSNSISSDSSNNTSYDSTASVLENFLSQCDVINGASISSNSSDSGLSSDNLETELSPEYEPFSPAASSPGPSISERGEKNSPPRNQTYAENIFDATTIHGDDDDVIIEKNSLASSLEPPNQLLQSSSTTTAKTAIFKKTQSPAILSSSQIQFSPKVIVQKVPQVVNLRSLTSATELPTTAITPIKRAFNQTFLDNSGFKQEKGIKIVKLSPQSTIASSGTMINGKKMVTIQLKNSTAVENGKIQTKPSTFVINNKGKVTEVKKLIPVQAPTVTATSNPRSILLPVTMQNVKGLKTYKVVNMPQTLKCYGNVNNKNSVNIASLKPMAQQNGKLILTNKTKVYANERNSDAESLIFEGNQCIEDDDDDFDNDDEDIEVERITPTPIKTTILSPKALSKTTLTSTSDESDSPYPKLILSPEEKRLLAKEGITLPSHYPLTKYEERELKRIRRKIRNKISAQDSRKRKKEYVDGLEERVKQCTEENQTLIKKLKILQTQNQNLMSQMKKLQAMLSRGTNKTAHPTTCMLVLLLSLALVATPNLKLGGQNAKEAELNELAQDAANEILQNRRNLLFNMKDNQNNDLFDEDFNMNDFITMNDALTGGGADNNELTSMLRNCKKNNNSNNEPLCKKIRQEFIDFDVDDFNWYQAKETQKQEEKKLQKNVYELAAEAYNKNKSQQTSGFNIGADIDTDILDAIKQRTTPGVLELNLDKLSSTTNNIGSTTTNTIAVE